VQELRTRTKFGDRAFSVEDYTVYQQQYMKLTACIRLDASSKHIIKTKSLAQIVFEILLSKRIGVTSLTFRGHVTSLVTWPFDRPYASSYS